MRYDSQVIYDFAEQLEMKARLAVALCTAAGTLIGGAVGWGLLGSLLRQAAPQGDPSVCTTLGALAGVLAGVWIGHDVGEGRAFWIRLAMHRMLCEVQIEENTRAVRPDRDEVMLASRAADRSAAAVVGASSPG